MFQVAMVRLIARHYRRSRDDLDPGELRCRWTATRAAISRIAAAKADLAVADFGGGGGFGGMGGIPVGGGGGLFKGGLGVVAFIVIALIFGADPMALLSGLGGGDTSSYTPPAQTSRSARAPSSNRLPIPRPGSCRAC